jgi:hypothetical protein
MPENDRPNPTHFHGPRLGALYPDACAAAPTYQPLYDSTMTAEDIERAREDGLRRLQAEIVFRRDQNKVTPPEIST